MVEFVKPTGLEALLATPHKDVDYLTQHDISLVLSKALTETFKAKPLEPKKYFAKYLLNMAAQKRNDKEVSGALSNRYIEWFFNSIIFDLRRESFSLNKLRLKNAAMESAARSKSVRRRKRSRSRRPSSSIRLSSSRPSSSLRTSPTTCLSLSNSCRNILAQPVCTWAAFSTLSAEFPSMLMTKRMRTPRYPR